MDNPGPKNTSGSQTTKSGSSAKPFLLGLLLGIIFTALLSFTLPAGRSPLEYASGAWENIFPPPSNKEFLAENSKSPDVKQTKSGLQFQVIKPGEGASPVATDTALVKYEGKLRNGSVFDANEQSPMPVNGVVPGFSEALQLMQKGGEYRIWIPSDLAYGDASPGPEVPPNSLLIFDITLLDFISQEQMEELQQQMQQGPPPAP